MLGVKAAGREKFVKQEVKRERRIKDRHGSRLKKYISLKININL